MNQRKEVLVCYDVEKDKSRNQILNDLKDLGLISIQKSVMWGSLLPAEIKQINRILEKYCEKTTDKAFILETEVSKKIKEKNIGYKNEFDNYLRLYDVL